MKYQRGIALSGLIFWGIVLSLVAVFLMKVLPTVLEYHTIKKDTRSVVEKMGPESTVADVRQAYRRFAEIDQLELDANLLDISKEGGKIVIEFDYDKKIHLFANVSLLIHYNGSTAGQ